MEVTFTGPKVFFDTINTSERMAALIGKANSVGIFVKRKGEQSSITVSDLSDIDVTELLDFIDLGIDVQGFTLYAAVPADKLTDPVPDSLPNATRADPDDPEGDPQPTPWGEWSRPNYTDRPMTDGRTAVATNAGGGRMPLDGTQLKAIADSGIDLFTWEGLQEHLPDPETPAE